MAEDPKNTATEEVVEMVKALREKVDAGVTMADVEEKSRELCARLDKNDADGETQIKALHEQIDGLQSKLDRTPVGGDLDSRQGKLAAFRETPEYKSFIGHIQKGLATDQVSTGGALVPDVLSREIINLVTEIDPIEQNADTITVDEGNWEEVIQTGNASTGWVAERGTRSETTAPTVGIRRTPWTSLYAEPASTQKQLAISAFDVEQWLINEIVTRLAYTKGVALVNGTGTDQPTGFMTDSDVTEIAGTHASELRIEGLVNLTDIEDQYSRSAAYYMKRSTTLTAWNLKSTSGQNYLLPDPSRAGAMTILGYQVIGSQSMPAIAANAYPVVFGDMRQAYRVINHPRMIVIRDEVTSKGSVLFYTEALTGGSVKNPAAIQKMKIATSV